VLADLVARLARLDTRPTPCKVLLLVEADDEDTRRALGALSLGPQFEMVLIPPGKPRTKPRPQRGLARASGEFWVIFDAEDRPEPAQLRKAVAGVRSLAPWVVCVQAELQY